MCPSSHSRPRNRYRCRMHQASKRGWRKNLPMEREGCLKFDFGGHFNWTGRKLLFLGGRRGPLAGAGRERWAANGGAGSPSRERRPLCSPCRGVPLILLLSKPSAQRGSPRATRRGFHHGSYGNNGFGDEDLGQCLSSTPPQARSPWGDCSSLRRMDNSYVAG
jgi:hypothetical protein